VAEDEKTRVTTVVQPTPSTGEREGMGADCLVVIYTKEPTMMTKRFPLDVGVLRIGRGSENQIILEGDSVSRRHARVEMRGDEWYVVDENSTNGTFVNDEQIKGDWRLENGDRVKVGPTIFKYLSGKDVEAQYHEEIYRMTIMDGLTGAFLKRYLVEALDKEIMRARRHERPLAFIMFDIDFFKRINDTQGHLAGDHVLKELAKVVLGRIRRDEVFARYGGEEFALLLPETSLEGALQLAEELRAKVEGSKFVFQGESIPVTISIGVALLLAAHRTAEDFIGSADEKLYQAKRSGRNRVCH
jgi:two-component system, cell cycle response regulator